MVKFAYLYFSVISFAFVSFSTSLFGQINSSATNNILSWTAHFKRPDPNSVASLEKDLLTDLASIHKKFASTPGFLDLYAELGLADLEEELRLDSGVTVNLNASIYQMRLNQPPLEEPEFASLRVKLKKLAAYQCSSQDDAEETYVAMLEDLADYAEQPSSAFDKKARKAYTWLRECGQAPLVTDWWKSKHSISNARIRLSASLIPHLFKPVPISQESNFVETKQEDGHLVTIHGSGKGSGEIDLQPLPSMSTLSLVANTRANIDGTGVASTMIRGKELKVYVDSHAKIDGRLPVSISRDMVLSIGDLDLDITADNIPRKASYAANLRFVRRMASQMALAETEKRRAQMNQETIAKIDKEIRAKVSEGYATKVQPRVTPMRSMVDSTFRFPLLRTEAFPSLSLFTQTDGFHLHGVFADKEQLSAPTWPLRAPEGDFAIQIHESFANNFSRLIVGKTLAEDVLRSAMFGQLFEQPEEDVTTGYDAFQLGFSKENPFYLNIDSRGLHVELEIDSIKSGAKVFSLPALVSASYKIDYSAGNLTLVRTAAPEIHLKVEKIDKRALKAVPDLMNRILVPRLVMKELKFSPDLGNMKLSIELVLLKMTTEESGWLNLSLGAKNASISQVEKQ